MVETKADYRASVVASVLLNAYRKKDSEAVSPVKVLDGYFRGEEEKEPDPADLRDKMRALFPRMKRRKA